MTEENVKRKSEKKRSRRRRRRRRMGNGRKSDKDLEDRGCGEKGEKRKGK